jgi:S-adenosylmethionine-diacylglycerol 3-amino-3-carboxypropyl transferase
MLTVLRDDQWLKEASAMPLAFAQVREDAWLDLSVAELARRQSGDLNICMVASGGCTAAYLAARACPDSLTLVDCNKAQLDLAAIKMHLLRSRSSEARLRLLGHEPMDAARRSAEINAICRQLEIDIDAIVPAEIASRGLDHCGRYERLFQQLQTIIATDFADAAWQYGRQSVDNNSMFAPAFARTFALPSLIALFGKAATANACKPFAEHFHERFVIASQAQAAENNPYLAQVLTGSYPDLIKAPWFDERQTDAVSPTFVKSAMTPYLQNQSERFDFVHLSNILDWLNQDQASATLAAAFNALRPGGLVFIRQLNSNLNVPVLGSNFVWSADAARMHTLDRSFFYQALHLGVKP